MCEITVSYHLYDRAWSGQLKRRVEVFLTRNRKLIIFSQDRVCSDEISLSTGGKMSNSEGFLPLIYRRSITVNLKTLALNLIIDEKSLEIYNEEYFV